MSTAPESSPAVGAASVEDVIYMAACGYVDFPGIGTIDLLASELSSNDREMLEVAMEHMFAELSILETIASIASVLRQYESAGGSGPPAAPEATEGVLEESAADAKSAMVTSAPWPSREDQGTPYPNPQKQCIGGIYHSG
jgi:hypothetical protein